MLCNKKRNSPLDIKILILAQVLYFCNPNHKISKLSGFLSGSPNKISGGMKKQKTI
jgi:hypothetical protein